MEYDDGLIACSESELVIRRYDMFLRPKRIPWERIKAVSVFRLGRMRGKWRLWGSGDFRRWYNLDPRRPGKEVGLELDLGSGRAPVITPDDPQRVVAVLRDHGVQVVGDS